ncbi:MAG: leucine-rich repeat protein [Lachnospiraceae bacterium]|nr:leucine-rich repeat protein [Lachnospiraceae bacterium]
MTKKKFLMVSLCIILIAGCGRNDEISIWSFDDEGKFYHISEEDYGDDSIIFTSDKYVVNNNSIDLGGEKAKIEYTDYGLKIIYESGYSFELYEHRQQALESNEKYWTSNTYYETIKDENGYVIEKDKLVKYFTNSNEILLPDTVNEIGKSVIVSEIENIEKITIVGEIKKIGASAFCETSVDIFVIEEGVEEIGDYAFSDSYFYEIHIPNSVIKIGKKAFNCSEGNEESKIYVKKGSYAEKYFAENEGVYDGDVIVEE